MASVPENSRAIGTRRFCRVTSTKSERGTQVAATFYSLIETAKLNGVDPTAYLLAAARAADRGEVLVPSQIAR